MVGGGVWGRRPHTASESTMLMSYDICYSLWSEVNRWKAIENQRMRYTDVNIIYFKSHLTAYCFSYVYFPRWYASYLIYRMIFSRLDNHIIFHISNAISINQYYYLNIYTYMIRIISTASLPLYWYDGSGGGPPPLCKSYHLIKIELFQLINQF